MPAPTRADGALRPALEHLVKGIVDNPDDVRVRLVDSRRGKRLEVRGRGSEGAVGGEQLVDWRLLRLGPGRRGDEEKGEKEHTQHRTSPEDFVGRYAAF